MDYSTLPTSSVNTEKPLPPPPPQDTHSAVDAVLFGRSKKQQYIRKGLLVSIAVVVLYSSYSFLSNRVAALTLAGTSPINTDKSDASRKSHVPQYFQTSPELWPGPTATGRAPFLAATNPVSFASTKTYIANEPLETGEPIEGMGDGDESIFRKMGHLSGYFANPRGFGVDEFRVRGERGEKIAMVQVG